MEFLMKLFLSCLGICLTVAMLGCGSAETTNSNQSANTNRIQNVDASNLPPGLSASPIIPVNSVNAVNSVKPGSTPTPGIPDPKTIGQSPKPGATPTPGIPDPATLKKQMEIIRRQMNSNSNQVAPPPAGPSDGQPPRRKRSITNVNN